MDNEKEIMNFFKTKRGKAIIFFIFYLLFFAFILNYNSKEKTKPLQQDEQPTTEIEIIIKGMEKIESANYRYTYTISENDTITTIVGKRLNNKAIYQINNTASYYKVDDNLFQSQNDTYIKVESNEKDQVFFDIKELKRIIKNSTLFSKTEYIDKKIGYTYNITTEDLVSLIKEKEIIDESINTIDIVLTDNCITKITLQLDNYQTQINGSKESLYIITQEYTDFGKIEDIIIDNIVE